ncbi:MAG TPA: SurA N-terminal domain-containing protein [Kiritimatiellia bacterium]|nr:SurA N-terminal domain-containing protein [Kiritimatiellia bacterium]HRU70012.1 SurA N-terminal domain-containing protein [Kiritimatiellia bacterium]
MFIYHFNRLIRSRILWGFFAIIIAIAFVAVDSCFRSPQDSMTAGSINGKKVPYTQFEQTVQAIRGFGRDRDTETAANVVDRRAWEQIAARQTAEKNGMGAVKEEIRNALREAPGFQGPNGFDINRYRMVLAEQGLTPAMYENLVAHQLSLMKNAVLVDSATWVSPMELEDELAAMTDRFTVQTVTISNRFAQSEMRLSEEDLRKYYEENKASFARPDRISVRYIAIPVSNYLAHVSVPEDDLMEYYDSHANTYTRTTTNNTTEPIPFAEVRDKILAELQLEEARYCASTAVTFTIYGKLADAGDNALDVAAEQAQVPLKTSPLFAADETLYWTENSKAFADAAFELDPDRSDSRFGIVKGDTFIYVIERKEFSAAHTPSYEDVLNELRPRAQAKARNDAFQDYVKELRKELRTLMDEGKSFADAATAKALNVSTSLTYSVNEIQNQTFPNSFSIAYGAMTLKKGELSEAIPASAAQSLLVYVQDRQPGDALAAEMMRAQVRTGIARRRSSNLFSDWLTWNLSKQDFKPARPLGEDDEDEALDADPEDPEKQ